MKFASVCTDRNQHPIKVFDPNSWKKCEFLVVVSLFSWSQNYLCVDVHVCMILHIIPFTGFFLFMFMYVRVMLMEGCMFFCSKLAFNLHVNA